MPLRGEPTLNPSRLRWAVLAPLAAAALVACGGGGGGSSGEQTTDACPETGTYACKSGETEPLYTFQWALNYAKSWFMDNADGGAYGGGYDLNVEPVHKQGIKGQGINVLVIDSGVDLAHEDLKDNADIGMSWNFETDMPDPSPALTTQTSSSGHGTAVAGIIGAAQNGKGVMGIAPRARIGGAARMTDNNDIWTLANFTSAFGGASWSSKVDVINGSYGGDTELKPYNLTDSAEIAPIRSSKNMRNGKGIVFIKAAGNEFDYAGNQGQIKCGPLKGLFGCINPANDPATLEPNTIVTAALNTKGQASSYSSAGSVLWITGLAGESGALGRYGELSGRTPAAIAAGGTGDGPTIFSTDISGCSAGFSQQPKPLFGGDFMKGLSELIAGVPDNPNCDYTYMNGTSSAAPTIAGVTTLMLSANPDLTWRDVRDILRLSARQVDPSYATRTRNDQRLQAPLPYNALFDLKTNSFVAQTGSAKDIVSGATQIPVELGWVRNAVGAVYSNWYGWGLPDAAKAVELAQLYKKEPSRSRSATQVIPSFNTVAGSAPVPYQQVSQIAQFEGDNQIVDEFQVRLNSQNTCLGSVGIVVESPSGTKSLLKLPIDHFVNHQSAPQSISQYGLGSYAFYGESAKGTWKIYAAASNPVINGNPTPACTPLDGAGQANGATITVEARVIAQ